MDEKESLEAADNGSTWTYRIQLFLGWLVSFLSGFGPVIAPGLMYYSLYGPFWWLGFIYIFYILNDGQVASRGGRLSEKVRNLSIFRMLAAYFPITLKKTVELDPSKNYLALTYPHGHLMVSQFLAFETNALNFKGTFPGLTSYMAHVDGKFNAPFLRELFLRQGGISVSEGSLLYMLDKNKYKGNFVVLNSGGSAEAMESRHDDYTLVLKNRKGWARVAIKSGASVVPVFAFGETRLYDTKPSPRGTFMWKIEEKIRTLTGIAPVTPRGRIFFNFYRSSIPHQSPVHVVVGAPIEVKQNSNPSKEEIDELHKKMLDSLTKFFEEQKKIYEKDPNIKLIII